MLLLDTTIVSELRKVRAGRADRNVALWAEALDPAELFTSSVVIHELEIGVLLAERRDPGQGSALREWLQTRVLPAFSGRILPIDAAVAQRAAALHVPDPRPINDAFIAATAMVHRMTVVTRNLSDFEATGVALLNPWGVRGNGRHLHPVPCGHRPSRRAGEADRGADGVAFSCS